MAEREIVKLDEFPSNSHKKKEEIVEKKTVKKVVKGSARTKKKSLGKRVAENLIEDDGRSVMAYILSDVLIPAAKATIQDMVTSGIEMLLFGGSGPSNDRIRRDRGRSYVSYSKYYDREERRPKRDRRTNHIFDEVILDSRRDAEDVLGNLVAIVDEYGEATVSDFYELVGITASYTDNKWGWDNLSSASVKRVREGYVISLPRTIPLD